MTAEHELILTRRIDAPAATLFRCWTDPALIKQWFAPLPYTTPAAARTAAILRAAWIVLDDLARSAPPVLLKGPRGGGRDRDEIVSHVIDTERAYARKIGIRHKPFTPRDHDAVATHREAVIDILGSHADGAPLTTGGWPPAYAGRRFAWHVLDHVWEIQDKSQ